MNRRTLLKRAGATAAVSIALTGTASGSADPPERLDVSGVSGEVPLTELVEDPEARFADGTFEGRDPAEIRVIVDEDDDVVEPARDIGCDLGCCCSAGSCPSGCDSCFCSVCGGCIA